MSWHKLAQNHVPQWLCTRLSDFTSGSTLIVCITQLISTPLPRTPPPSFACICQIWQLWRWWWLMLYSVCIFHIVETYIVHTYFISFHFQEEVLEDGASDSDQSESETIRWSPFAQQCPVLCKSNLQTIIKVFIPTLTQQQITDYPPSLFWFTISTSSQLRKTIHISLLGVIISGASVFFSFFRLPLEFVNCRGVLNQTLISAACCNKNNKDTFSHCNDIYHVYKNYAWVFIWKKIDTWKQLLFYILQTITSGVLCTKQTHTTLLLCNRRWL